MAVTSNAKPHENFVTFSQYVKIDEQVFLLNSQWMWAQKMRKRANASCGCGGHYYQYLITADVDGCKLDKAIWVRDDFVFEETGKRPKVERHFPLETRGDYYQEDDQDTLQPMDRTKGTAMSDEHGYIQVNEGYMPVPARDNVEKEIPKNTEIKES